MRRLVLAAALILASTLGCRKQSSGDTGGMTDTSTTLTPTPPPRPAAPDTSAGPRDFGFEERQQFAQSIRAQLGDIDRQIQDLSAQAKSRGGAVSDRALANIRASRKAIDRNLGRVDAASAANWEQVKRAVTRSVDQVSESIEAAQPK